VVEAYHLIASGAVERQSAVQNGQDLDPKFLGVQMSAKPDDNEGIPAAGNRHEPPYRSFWLRCISFGHVIACSIRDIIVEKTVRAPAYTTVRLTRPGR
jgi:hypothetical protein